ncbi:hypothetical protein NQZ79_g5413 [Umbelopsis isabellina]|nr:hypothetical protein NQZ79_g5413 [Umbelopsis isabellina]
MQIKLSISACDYGFHFCYRNRCSKLAPHQGSYYASLGGAIFGKSYFARNIDMVSRIVYDDIFFFCDIWIYTLQKYSSGVFLSSLWSQDMLVMSLDFATWEPFQQSNLLAVDLLNPSIETEKRQHKLKRLVQSPNSYFMDVKCPGCFNITTVFSHAQTVVLCSSCATVLCQPTGGRARLTEGCSFRRKLN